MSHSIENIKTTLKEHLAKETAAAGVSLKDDTNLFDSGVFDSLTIVKLVSFVEEKFNCVIDFEELNEENLACINSIASLLKKKTDR